MAEGDHRVGAILGGKYRILRLRARGGMSEIYEALNEDTEETVVIKCLPRRLTHQPDLVKRFKQECTIYSKLLHPHIVRVLDAGHMPDGTLYIVMEMLDGGSLREELFKGRLHPLHALDVANQLCRALAFAHAKEIYHRDIKPENVMVSKNGHVRLVDFGLAKWAADGGLASQEMPLMGTVGYMAPEAAQRRSDADHRVDIYATGVLMYEMMTGDNPFDRDREATSIEVLAAHQHVEPPPLHELDLTPKVPVQVSRIVAKCLAKNPEDRYANVNDLARDVRAEQRRLIESGDPLAELFMESSDAVPVLPPAMPRSDPAGATRLERPQPQTAPPAAAGEAKPPPPQQAPQPTAQAPSPSVRRNPRHPEERQITLELPVGFKPGMPVTPFEGAARWTAPASGRGATERIPPLPAQTSAQRTAQPNTPAATTAPVLRGRGFTERMLPLPAQAPPQSATPPRSTTRNATPVTRETWALPPAGRVVDTASAEPSRTLVSGGTPRARLLWAPAMGLGIAALSVLLGPALRSAWQGQTAPSAESQVPISVPVPVPAPALPAPEASAQPPPEVEAPPSVASASAAENALPATNATAAPTASAAANATPAPATPPRSNNTATVRKWAPAPAANPKPAKPTPVPPAPTGKPVFLKKRKPAKRD